MTVDDVAQSTRIRATLVRAIEHDDYSLCGGAVYTRGHIRSIARAVGVDPEPLITEFDATSDTVPPLVTDTIFEAETKSRPERSGPRWGFAMAAAVLVAICAVALNSILHASPSGHSGRQAAGAAATTPVSPTTTTKPSATHKPKPAQPNGPPVAAEPRDGVNLRIRVIGPSSWLSVHNAAGTSLVQKVLTHGQVFDAHDPRLLHLIVGDAGSVDLIVNGKELGPPGKRGAVMHLTFKPGDQTSSQG